MYASNQDGIRTAESAVYTTPVRWRYVLLGALHIRPNYYSHCAPLEAYNLGVRKFLVMVFSHPVLHSEPYEAFYL
jgi:hypothetical protein